MSERKNAGYTITDSLHIGKAEFVIGEHSKVPSPYVTWECSEGVNYFWGHYFADRRAAEKDVLTRAQQELEFCEQQEQQAEVSKTASGSRCHSADVEYEAFWIFGHDALFTDKRIDKNTLPKGMYAYDIRHAEDGDPGTLEKNVFTNFYGTVILNRPISLGRYNCKDIGSDDYGFREESLLTLNDYMKSHPPKNKEAER